MCPESEDRFFAVNLCVFVCIINVTDKTNNSRKSNFYNLSFDHSKMVLQFFYKDETNSLCTGGVQKNSSALMSMDEISS